MNLMRGLPKKKTARRSVKCAQAAMARALLRRLGEDPGKWKPKTAT